MSGNPPCKRKEDTNHSVGVVGGTPGGPAAAAAAALAAVHVSSAAGSVAPPTVTHLSASKSQSQTKKPRLVFTDLQRRTLQAIFKETKRPSKEMQIAISQQLGLELSTVGNFFMNARRRSQDKWLDDSEQQQIKRDVAAVATVGGGRPPSELHQQSQQGATPAGALKGITGTPAGLLHSHTTATGQPADHDGGLGLEDELMHGRHSMGHGLPQQHLSLRHNINQWSPW
ncbi:homeobox protein onecut-like [Varroa destructor]|uniref:Homeobox domain-containing protein n=1 Tax=Varroa destructor TaxID=109461 RepID=A0A7M7K146_VARDE|nr:homeobox protein onecut-like [Varroa destructor]